MTISPIQFFGHLKWIDGRPLLDVIEPYRRKIFADVFGTLGSDGRRKYNRVLCSRGKKGWKSADAVLAGLYVLFTCEQAQGADGCIVANDLDQAGDDLTLAKKIIQCNPILANEVTVKSHEIERNDTRGSLRIIPARDVAGAHGKSFAYIGYDEIHSYRDYGLFEALSPDPHREVVEWIASYNSIYTSPGYPLADLIRLGKSGADPRFYFSFYSGSFSTDPAFQGDEMTPEVRANPSMASWGNSGYLAQQKQRLPSNRYRRLHLNEAGSNDGAFLDAVRITDAVVEGRKVLRPVEGVEYVGFVDMSGGSSDDAALAIAHFDAARNRAVVDLVATQTGKPPFNPRDAVRKFADLLKQYRVSAVTGDRYAGQTFEHDFLDHRIGYRVSQLTKSQLYEALEPRVNAGELELLDVPKLIEQLLGLVAKGTKIDHLPGDHDDLANAAAGAVSLCTPVIPISADGFATGVISFGRPDIEPHQEIWSHFYH